jgi:Ni,Fe-hydrogenase III small subunit
MTESTIERYKTNLFGLVWRRFCSIKNWIVPTHTRAVNDRKHRSVFIRAVDGGSSNAEELEIANLSNPVYDIAHYGFHLVASPRHADVLLISGPLTNGMRSALIETFRAMPEPRKVVTLGDAFAPDSFFSSSYAVVPLPDEILDARVAHIPGDPPTPQQMIEILLTLDF